MKKSKKNSITIALIVLLLALAVGYAAFTSNLVINGTVARSGKWDVKFDSVTLVDENMEADSTHGTVTLSEDKQIATANIKLSYPGDGVMIQAIVKNTGSIDALLESFEITGTDDADIEITKNAAMVEGQTLLANGGSCVAQFAIKWKADSTKTALGTKEFKITYNYTQKAQEVNLNPQHNDVNPS